MKKFLEWVKEKNLPLPLNEKTKRAGISDNYPPAYAQKGYGYPDLNFTPISANAVGKLQGKMGS